MTLIAFPRQEWFGERASILRYTYIACLVCGCSRVFIKLTTLHIGLPHHLRMELVSHVGIHHIEKMFHVTSVALILVHIHLQMF
jgi:hypothetical protein